MVRPHESSAPSGEPPPRAPSDWAALASDALRGRAAETLTRTTLDGIELPPIGFPDEVSVADTYPGEPPFGRGAEPAATSREGWLIRPRVEIGEPEAARAAVLAELEGGATAVELAVAPDPSTPLEPRLRRALDGVLLEAIPLALDAGLDPATALDALVAEARSRRLEPGDLHLAVNADPLGQLARCGSVSELWQPSADEARALVRRVSESLPYATTFRVATSPYHDAGASDAQELAALLATGVEYLRLMERAGLGLQESLGQIRFALSLDTDLFGGLAKVRAARLLWARVVAVCDGGAAGAPRLEAVVARRCLSRLDPWVNVLRSVTAAFVAAVGGIEALTVPAYDETGGRSSERGRRLARNTQLILRDEAHLHRVIDPAGGAWLIEQTTERLAGRAWELFQELESEGGLAAALAAGHFQERIAEVAARRARRIARRLDGLIGVSEFAALDRESTNTARSSRSGEDEPAAPSALPLRRLAAPFESLRDRSDRLLLERGARPRVFLATLGRPAEFNPRASFTRNLLAAGGLEAFEPEAGEDDDGLGVEAIARAFAGTHARVAIVCSSDQVYERQGAAVVAALREAGAGTILLAGRPQAIVEELEAVGLEAAFAAGDDVLALLERIWCAVEGAS